MYNAYNTLSLPLRQAVMYMYYIQSIEMKSIENSCREFDLFSIPTCIVFPVMNIKPAYMYSVHVALVTNTKQNYVLVYE